MAPAPKGSEGDVGEITVTATRQSQTINKVPLSISAVSQETIDKQGLKNVQDLARTVPGMTFKVTGGDTVPQISIRGITNTGGSQTTAVYLDDAPLQARGLGGSPVTGAGTPLPQLFDLERVEVLKGPQGTLYGGSAEGGAVRFITPTPSLTHFSGAVRAEGSTIEHGSPGYDFGVAVGGPIVEDKLGIRVSFRQRRIGGYIDEVSRFDGSVVNSDTNWSRSRAFRATLLWKPTERLSITPSAYLSSDKTGDLDSFWFNMPQIVVPTKMFTSTGAVTTDPSKAVYTLPGHTYGPYNFYGPFRNGQVTNVGDDYKDQVPLKGLPSPNSRTLNVYSNNIQYDFDAFKANLITSYLTNSSKGSSDVSFIPVYFAYGSPYEYNLKSYYTTILYNAKRHLNTDELRFTSQSSSRLSWVGGLYYSKSHMRSYAPSYWNANDLTQASQGISDVQVYGVPLLDPATGLTGVRDQRVDDTELAAYLNADYKITDKLKATVGVRFSKVKVSYKSYNYGQATGTSVATVENGGLVTGSTTEKPITPKFGLSYQLDSKTLFYANAAKGFRPGGINLPASASLCGNDFKSLGITATPLTYGSDSVWSYEGGVKTRLFQRAQVNASVFYIDWTKPQTTVTLPTCGNSYLINAGKAVSKGFDTDMTIRLFGGLNLTGSLAYTDTTQKETVGLNTPSHPIFVREGDSLAVPKWSYSIGAEYDYRLFGHLPSYLRIDYQYSGSYKRSGGPGTATYNPVTYNAAPTHFVSARAAVTIHDIEFTAFVNNLTNSRDILSISSIAKITSASTFRPREIGGSIGYKF